MSLKQTKTMSVFSQNPLNYISKSEFTMNIPCRNIIRLFVAYTLATIPTVIQAQSQQGVEAQLDVAHTVKNNTIILDVIKNDYESPWSGTLHLDKIVLVNHGQATIENGKIIFTPDDEFKGSALINYTACNDFNQCDCGLAIVEVSDNPMPTYQEMKIFALEDATVTFTLPLGFTLSESAKRGSVNPTAQLGEWEYKPNSQMVGQDNCVFNMSGTDGAKGYEVRFEVLKKPAQYVSNDIFATAVGKITRFNVLDNDYKNAIRSVTYGSCTGGTIQGFDDGWVTFVPNPSFKGQATFTYTVTYNTGVAETARVIINVSNFLPAKEQFTLTCAGIPLVIKYPVSISDYRFEPLSPTTDRNGSIKFYTSIDTIIAGQKVKGENILLYVPNLNSGASEDAFWLRYCVNDECADDFVQVVINLIEPPTSEDLCVSECIWPGDANADGIVNILDIFPIGGNMGRYGTNRNDRSAEWYGHGGEDWGQTAYLNSGADLKHADTNGDGVISAEDVNAIYNNYSNNSTIVPYKSIQEGAIEVQLISSVSSARPGDLIEMIVSMGNAENPTYDAKGFDAQLIKEESINADFNFFTWLSRYDAYLPFSKNVERGKLEAGLVRSKGKGANGHGEVGKIKAIVTDDIAGFRANDKSTLKFSIKDAYLMGANGQAVKLQTKDLEIPLVIGKKTDVLKNDDLIMYPNPANDMINFHINGVNKIDYVRIMDAAGREVSFLKNVDAKSASINLDASMRGFYIAEIMTEKGRIIRKLEVFK
jgi:Secretion system C-terminal sorting domain/Bacterial Ig domain